MTAVSSTTPQSNATYVSAHRHIEVALTVRGVYSGGGGKHSASDQGLLLNGELLCKTMADSMVPEAK